MWCGCGVMVLWCECGVWCYGVVCVVMVQCVLLWCGVCCYGVVCVVMVWMWRVVVWRGGVWWYGVVMLWYGFCGSIVFVVVEVSCCDGVVVY